MGDPMMSIPILKLKTWKYLSFVSQEFKFTLQLYQIFSRWKDYLRYTIQMKPSSCHNLII